MKTIESVNKKELYKSPSAMVIDIAGESVICTSSGTEGYGMNSQSLDDGDFE